MAKRQVAILYIHPLFAQGIARLLEADPRVQVSCVDASHPEAVDELRRLAPQVVVIEHDLQGPALGSVPIRILGSEEWALLIVLGLKQPEMELFYNRRVSIATPATLLEAVLEESTTGSNASGHFLPPGTND